MRDVAGRLLLECTVGGGCARPGEAAPRRADCRARTWTGSSKAASSAKRRKRRAAESEIEDLEAEIAELQGSVAGGSYPDPVD
jgi:hypothetical protein